jgi:hypothetical protein
MSDDENPDAGKDDKRGGGGRGPTPRAYLYLMLVWGALGAFTAYQMVVLGPTPIRWLLLAVAAGGVGLNLFRMRR